MEEQNKKYKGLTLILSGGAMKSFSYLGFLEAFDREGIKVDTIAGLSGGSLMAIGHGLGYSKDDLQEAMASKNLFSMFGLQSIKDRSIISSRKIKDRLTQYIGDATFDDLPYKLVIFATNLTKKRLEYFASGELRDFARAAIALVPVISSKWIGNNEYIDAGFSTIFPTSIMRQFDRDNLIVGLFPKKHFKLLPESVMKRARYLEYIYEQLNEYMIKEDKPDMIIETLSEDKGYGFSYDLIDYYYEEGKKSADKYLPIIKEKLELHND